MNLSQVKIIAARENLIINKWNTKYILRSKFGQPLAKSTRLDDLESLIPIYSYFVDLESKARKRNIRQRNSSIEEYFFQMNGLSPSTRQSSGRIRH